jgi:hypothetical protein
LHDGISVGHRPTLQPLILQLTVKLYIHAVAAVADRRKIFFVLPTSVSCIARRVVHGRAKHWERRCPHRHNNLCLKFIHLCILHSRRGVTQRSSLQVSKYAMRDAITKPYNTLANSNSFINNFPTSFFSSTDTN